MADLQDKIAHNTILRMINDDVHPSTTDFSSLKEAAMPYLTMSVIKACKDSLDLFWELEKSGRICLGNYDVLKKILTSANLIALCRKIEEKEEEISPASRQRLDDGVDANIVVHNDILRLINQDISPYMRDFDRLKSAAKIYLTPATVADCKSGFDICYELEKAGYIRIGEYGPLKVILTEVQLIALKRQVEEKEKEIKKENARENMKTKDTQDHRLQEDAAPPSETRAAHAMTSSAPASTTASSTAPKTEPLDISLSLSNAVSRRIFRIIQNSAACKKWKALGRELNLRESDIDAIENDNPLQLKEQCYAVLHTWVQSKASSATPKILTDALKRLSLTKVADDVTNFLLNLPFDN